MTGSPVLTLRRGRDDAGEPAGMRSPGPAAIRAVIYREFLLLTRNRTNLVLSIMPTVIYLLLFSTSLSRMVGTVTYHGLQVSYPEFTVPAIMLSSMLAASTTTGTALFQEEIGGMAVELWSYPMTRIAYISGKILATTALVLAESTAALMLGVFLFSLHWPVGHWLAIALATVAASLVFNGLFLLLASLVRDFRRFMVLVNIIGPLLLFSSPSFYPVEQMPPILSLVSRVNPVTYGINSVRDGAVFGLGATWPTIIGLLITAAGLFATITTVLTRRSRDL